MIESFLSLGNLSKLGKKSKRLLPFSFSALEYLIFKGEFTLTNGSLSLSLLNERGDNPELRFKWLSCLIVLSNFCYSYFFSAFYFP